MSEIIYLNDAATINCIVDKDRTDAVLLAAREMGATAALVHTVQGWGIRERLGAWGVASETEKDHILFLVSADQQELISETIYRVAQMDAPGRGVMFISPVDKVATYIPESIRKRFLESEE
jgi:nitrogen regulatory protein PII